MPPLAGLALIIGGLCFFIVLAMFCFDQLLPTLINPGQSWPIRITAGAMILMFLCAFLFFIGMVFS